MFCQIFSGCCVENKSVRRVGGGRETSGSPTVMGERWWWLAQRGAVKAGTRGLIREMFWRQNPWNSPETEWGHKRKNKGGKGDPTVFGGPGHLEGKVGWAGTFLQEPMCFLPTGNKDSPSSQLLTHHS